MKKLTSIPRTNAADGNNPYGSLKDETVEGGGDGTPVRSDWLQDLKAGAYEVLDRAGITPNDVVDNATTNQFADAIEAIIDDHIGANLVDNAHMADMPSMTIKGNDAGIATDPQDLTVSEVKTMLGLQNVTNESKATMFTDPTFTGTPTAPTAPPGTSSTQVATTEFVSDVETALDTRIDSIESWIPGIESSLDVLNDFRSWDSSRAYAINDPVFHLGIPYRARTANTNKTPSTSPTDWEVVGGGAGSIGNIAPDPEGSKGNAGWTTTNAVVSTQTTTLTGFKTELKITGSGVGNAIWTIDVPAQLRGEELEFRYEGYLFNASGTPVISVLDGNDNALPFSGSIPTTTGKFESVGRFYSNDTSTVKIKITVASGTDLRMTNIYLGRREVVYGASIGPWTPYPAGTYVVAGVANPVTIAEGKIPAMAVTTNPTKATSISYEVAEWRQNGEDIEIHIAFDGISGGSNGSGEAVLPLPLGKTTPENIAGSAPYNTTKGYGTFHNPGVINADLRIPLFKDNAFKLWYGNDTTNGALAGDFCVSSQKIEIYARVKCSQFIGSGVVQLAEAGGTLYLSNTESVANTNGVVGKTFRGIEGSLIPSNTAATYYDCALDAPLMPDQVPVLEVRSKVDGNWIPVEIASVPSLYITRLAYAFVFGNPANYYGRGFSIAKTSSNTIRVQVSSSLEGGTSSLDSTPSLARSWANITAAADGYDRWRVRIEKAGARQETPTVGMNVKVNNKASNTTTPVVFTGYSELKDTHSILDITTGKITIPIDGWYSINGMFWGSTSGTVLNLYKNNSNDFILANQVTSNAFTAFAVTRYFNRGDQLDFRTDTSVTVNLWTNIARIGA